MGLEKGYMCVIAEYYVKTMVVMVSPFVEEGYVKTYVVLSTA